MRLYFNEVYSAMEKVNLYDHVLFKNLQKKYGSRFINAREQIIVFPSAALIRIAKTFTLSKLLLIIKKIQMNNTNYDTFLRWWESSYILKILRSNLNKSVEKKIIKRKPLKINDAEAAIFNFGQLYENIIETNDSHLQHLKPAFLKKDKLIYMKKVFNAYTIFNLVNIFDKNISKYTNKCDYDNYMKNTILRIYQFFKSIFDKLSDFSTFNSTVDLFNFIGSYKGNKKINN